MIGYIHYEAPVEEQNFSTLIEFLNAMEVREDDEEFQNPVDLMFEALEKKKPNHFAVRQYKKYKLAAGKTAKSILISCGARLAPFDIQEVRDVTAYDELQLDTLGDKKTALFLIMSDTDATFNFLISMIYTQLFNLLCEKADDVYGGKLPIHVRCLIDECANIGQIPNLEKLVATIRSREISACLVLQARSQLKAIYKDNADTIVGNMDSQIFLGGSEPTTLKDLSEMLGKETIDAFNTSDTRGNSPRDRWNNPHDAPVARALHRHTQIAPAMRRGRFHINPYCSSRAVMGTRQETSRQRDRRTGHLRPARALRQPTVPHATYLERRQ